MSNSFHAKSQLLMNISCEKFGNLRMKIYYNQRL